MAEAKLFLLAGLGADSRIFSRLTLPGVKMVMLDWLVPQPQETLQEYSRRMCLHWKLPHGSTLLGVSLGGIVTQEMGSLTDARKIILVSSIASPHEIPQRLKWLKFFHAYKKVKAEHIRKFGMLARRVLGKEYKEGTDIFRQMLEETPAEFLTWGLEQVLTWKGSSYSSEKIARLHGDKDLVFPASLISNATIISGANHFMIYNRAGEVSKAIAELLKEQ